MNRHRFRSRDYVEHMLEACVKIERYVFNKQEADFFEDSMLQDAVARNLEILGEATRQLRDVLPDADARFPGIPFRTIYATRNRLTHAYALVNQQIIWEVAQQDIPVVRGAIEEVLASWPDDLPPE